MGEFRMPSLGADMEAGKLVEWLVKPGAPVKRGDIIAVVETQKGAIEIEVFDDGVFERPLVEIGATVPVGTPLADHRRRRVRPCRAAAPAACGAAAPKPVAAGRLCRPRRPPPAAPAACSPPPAAERPTGLAGGAAAGRRRQGSTCP